MAEARRAVAELAAPGMALQSLAVRQDVDRRLEPVDPRRRLPSQMSTVPALDRIEA